MFPRVKGAFDTQLFLYDIDPRDYRVCQIFNVCFDMNNYYIIIEDDQTREYYVEQQGLCASAHPQRQKFCRCFSRSMYPIFVKSLSEVKNYTLFDEHMWVSDQWVHSRHIFHWMQQRIIFHSIFLQEEYYG